MGLNTVDDSNLIKDELIDLGSKEMANKDFQIIFTKLDFIS